VPDSMVWCLWWWVLCCEAPRLNARAACKLPHLSTANSIKWAFQVENRQSFGGDWSTFVIDCLSSQVFEADC
jgi:hypothetical protein